MITLQRAALSQHKIVKWTKFEVATLINVQFEQTRGLQKGTMRAFTTGSSGHNFNTYKTNDILISHSPLCLTKMVNTVHIVPAKHPHVSHYSSAVVKDASVHHQRWLSDEPPQTVWHLHDVIQFLRHSETANHTITVSMQQFVGCVEVRKEPGLEHRLSSFLFSFLTQLFLSLVSTSECDIMNALQERLSANVCHYSLT